MAKFEAKSYSKGKTSQKRILTQSLDNALKFGRTKEGLQVQRNIVEAYSRVYAYFVVRRIREFFGSRAGKKTAGQVAKQKGYTRVKTEYPSGWVATTYASIRDGKPNGDAVFTRTGLSVRVGTNISYEVAMLRGLPVSAQTSSKMVMDPKTGKRRPVKRPALVNGRLIWIPGDTPIKWSHSGFDYIRVAQRDLERSKALKKMTDFAMQELKKSGRIPSVNQLYNVGRR